ncbi:MAG: polysaccharide deacetylase family protein [Actinobacteria bacterium]|nr:polysaccharide deacetylase family protein [Actinomycetota bacterium]
MSRRDRAAGLLAAPVARYVVRRLPRWRGVLVLNYHRVGDLSASQWDRDLWSATGEALDAQLAVLAREAEVIGPDDVAAAQRERRAGRRVLLTFDDGYRDNYEIAYPLLRRHGVTATFFPVSGYLDDPCVPWWDEVSWMVRNASARELPPSEWMPEALALGDDGARDAAIKRLLTRYKQLESPATERFLEALADATGSGRCPAELASEQWMTWEMAREMRDGGMAFGGHTVTHPVLSKVTAERRAEEVGGCARRHREELGAPMRWFAYPVGSREIVTAPVKRSVGDAGVELAFSFYGGWGGFAGWDPLDVPRVHVGPSYSVELLRAALAFPRAFGRW